MFKNREQRLAMTWEELAQHYNLCVAKGLEELGKLGPNEYDYLSTVKKEVEMRLDNPKYHLSIEEQLRTPERNKQDVN